MNDDRKNRSERFERSEESTRERREALEKPTSMHDGGKAPSQQSQKMPFSPPGKGEGKDDQIERAMEDREVRFRREDKETNKSGDPRIGTHDREYD